MNRLLPFLFLLLSFNAYAVKPFSVGLGVYSSTIAFDEPLAVDHDLSGLALSFAYAFSDQFALRASLFSLEHDDFSDTDSRGYDVLAHLGTGLASTGFKAYIGGGFFRDEWDFGSSSETFDGLQLNGGIGYSWSAVSLDFDIGIRDQEDYEDFFNEASAADLSAAAITTNLMLSLRF